jgi:large subunit ribosomal protein L2
MIKSYKPKSEGLRTRKTLVVDVDYVRPQKKLSKGLVGPAGRSRGRISSRHKQRGSKKLYREIDFKRTDKLDIPAKVQTIEYDPNRGPNIALLSYKDGEKRYILAPAGLERGMTVVSSESAELKIGNSLPMKNIPLGMDIHNIEINPGAGGRLCRGAGNSAQIIAKEDKHVNIKLPSGEVKQVSGGCFATLGVLSNEDLRNTQLGKAGRNRYKGNRPHVRGVAMNDPHHDHPHAGKYKTSGVGMHPKTPWGKKARGVKTRRRNKTNYTIIKSRGKRR